MNTEENTITSPTLGTYGTKLADKYPLKPLNNLNDAECFLLEDKTQIKQLLNEIKKAGFKTLSTINCVEYKEGMQITYHLINLNKPKKPINIFIKANILTDNGLNIDTISDIYASADWYERELYDLQGIVFDGHDNLTRILSPDLWTGHPLRKDYIPPLDTLNGPITTVKKLRQPNHSIRQDVEVIIEPPTEEIPQETQA